MFYSQGHLMFSFPHQEENDWMVIQHLFWFFFNPKIPRKTLGLKKIGVFLDY
jgi:hypothetical protein